MVRRVNKSKKKLLRNIFIFTLVFSIVGFVFGLVSNTFLGQEFTYNQTLGSSESEYYVQSNQRFGDSILLDFFDDADILGQPGYTLQEGNCNQLLAQGLCGSEATEITNQISVVGNSIDISISEKTISPVQDSANIENLKTGVVSTNLDIDPSSLDSMTVNYNYNLNRDLSLFAPALSERLIIGLKGQNPQREIVIIDRTLERQNNNQNNIPSHSESGVFKIENINDELMLNGNPIDIPSDTNYELFVYLEVPGGITVPPASTLNWDISVDLSQLQFTEITTDEEVDEMQGDDEQTTPSTDGGDSAGSSQSNNDVEESIDPFPNQFNLGRSLIISLSIFGLGMLIFFSVLFFRK